jgi:uncharacterized protein involved in exopolysaccharide biosynthesis
VDIFVEDVRSVTEDKRSGLVIVSIEWSDRELAAQWANDFVAMANRTIRDRVIHDSEKAIEYLNREVEKTNLVEVQQGINRLIESQIKNIAMASVHEDFAFRVIDPAVPPEPNKFVRPQRIMLIALGLTLGFVLAVLVVLIRETGAQRPANIERSRQPRTQ